MEDLTYKSINVIDKLTDAEKSSMENLCSEYRTFLDLGKTERECVEYTKELAEKNGYKNIDDLKELKPGDKVYKDAFYIHNNVVARCLNGGDWEEFTTDNFKVIYDNYHWGKAYTNLTKNLIVNNFNYDSYTHEYLGDYLRFLRDYRGVDLMSLYNCFSNREVSSISVTDGTEEIFSNKDGSKVYVIPIEPFTEYTIFVDSNEPIEILSGYYSNGLINPFEGLDDTSSSYTFPYKATYMKASCLSFNKPIVYDKMNKDNMTSEVWANIASTITYNQRKNLKMFVKVPSTTITSSLVILEGRYTQNQIYHFDENSDLKLVDKINAQSELGETVKNRTELTKLSLTKLQSFIQHPFADRLVEYLLSNAIQPFDTIDNNISRVQDKLVSGVAVKVMNYSETPVNTYVRLHHRGIDGEWNQSMTNTVLGVAKARDLLNSKYDILGYVDKDIETVLGMEDK